ncbi:hypothetical protein [Exiguobacterium sp. NG55]|uniref:hypothetical protein n=1 Tax=Exiguobacterium sp. NG55 TaxID=375477 RepID=UPI0004DEF8CD|nr:hypothetical protein [Exiguobacterium sp. NG55]
MLTPLQAQYFEFLMWKANKKLERLWDKQLLICSDGQLFTGNFFQYDELANPYAPSLNGEQDWISLGHENQYSRRFYQWSKSLHAGVLQSFTDDKDLDALIFMYALDTLKSIEKVNSSTDGTPVLLFNAKSLATDKEYSFIHLGNQVNILSVVD